MELKRYFSILAKNWWILVPVFLISTLATIIFTVKQPSIYAVRSTFVLRPRAEITDSKADIVRIVDLLSNRVEINATTAEIATSRLIRQTAADKQQLSAKQLKDLSVSANPLAGTNVLVIIVEGKDPNMVRDFSVAIGMETVNYIENLYDVFQLEPLDQASLPETPVRPNKPLNIIIGAALGLLLGVCMVFVKEYIKPATNQ